MEADYVYFRRRAADERTRAATGASLNARLAHLELASRYEDLATQIEAQMVSDAAKAA